MKKLATMAAIVALFAWLALACTETTPNPGTAPNQSSTGNGGAARNESSTRTALDAGSRERGQVPVQDPGQTLDRGRFGTQGSVSSQTLTWNGILVDAGCRDRSAANLKGPPASTLAAGDSRTPAPATGGDLDRSEQGRAATGRSVAQRANPSGGETDQGVTVSGKDLENERSDVMEHQTPDHLSRQLDPSCAISGATRSFALYTAQGELLNLDYGGSTRAYEAFQSSRRGRAVMNGRALSWKPWAEVDGTRRGDTIRVDTIKLK